MENKDYYYEDFSKAILKDNSEDYDKNLQKFLTKNKFFIKEKNENTVIYENDYCYLFHNLSSSVPAQYNKKDWSFEEAQENEKEEHDNSICI